MWLNVLKVWMFYLQVNIYSRVNEWFEGLYEYKTVVFWNKHGESTKGSQSFDTRGAETTKMKSS